jgi:hypothetical protein
MGILVFNKLFLTGKLILARGVMGARGTIN